MVAENLRGVASGFDTLIFEDQFLRVDLEEWSCNLRQLLLHLLSRQYQRTSHMESRPAGRSGDVVKT